MNWIVIFCVICGLCSQNLAESRHVEHDGDRAMENPDLFEGDMLGFTPEDRNAVTGRRRLWPEGKIPYVIDPALKSRESKMKEAMQHYADKTCIRFVPRTNETNYVNFFPGRGCYSHVGKTIGGQPLSLSAGCFNFGILVHEMGHAVGFYHEHSRSDRDDYIDIHYDNIQTGMEDQFTKLRPSQNILINRFNYDSIMLYGDTVFSKNHLTLKTMTAKDGRQLKDVTKKSGLSESDIKRIKILYDC